MRRYTNDYNFKKKIAFNIKGKGKYWKYLVLEQTTLGLFPESSERAEAGKMAACALRRGLWSTVSNYNRKHTHRILSLVDSASVFEVNRPALSCRACKVTGGVQPRRFMSSR